MTIKKEVKTEEVKPKKDYKKAEARPFRVAELEALIEICKRNKISEIKYSAVQDLTIELKFDENAFAEKLDDDMLKELIKKTSADDLLFASAN